MRTIPFPKMVSLTITNKCNLHCQMCGQWSEEGYMHARKASLQREMALADWQRVIDELAEHGIGSVLVRGGEPFLYPHIIELLAYLRSKGLFISIDTNGTLLEKFAADLVRLGGIHLTISLDGPQAVHDYVRGSPGCFDKIRGGLQRLAELEAQGSEKISRSFNFTISRYSYLGLGALPDTARSLGLNAICIVPYYYFPEAVGKAYEETMRREFDSPAYSWRGFHHEESGVDFGAFQAQYAQFQASLGELLNFPYMPLTEAQYRAWFGDPHTPVGPQTCGIVESLIDIQPSGDANFCVDFPDYVIGNVLQASIVEIWNGERAERFRSYRRLKSLPVCLRCGAKYMAEMEAA